MSTIILYKNLASPETVNKSGSLTQLATITGDFRGSVDILHPTITVQPSGGATVAALLKQCNYLYLQDIGRYYFIDNIVCVSSDLFDLECSIDVLYTWRTEILAQKVIVSRNEKEYQLYLDDSALKVYNNPNISTYNFRDTNGNITGFTAQNFIMAIAGS